MKFPFRSDQFQAAEAPVAPRPIVNAVANRAGSAERSDRGYVMLAIVAMLAVLAVVVYKIIPQYAFDARRDREEELIFRGEAYRTAIQLYIRKFGRFPNTLEELVS